MTVRTDVIFEVMNIQIELTCPACHSTSVKKNGKKVYGKQNYQCKDCRRQFIGDHALTYNGCHSMIDHRIRHMLARGVGIRDTAELQGISAGKVLTTLVNSEYKLTPQKTYYKSLEVDEFWTFVGSKKNKQWLIYAYDRQTGEIVAYVWGRRNLQTANQLRKRLIELGIKYGKIASDNWDSFVTAFEDDEQSIGKQYTVGIEGNNCRLRHRIRRAFRKTCCFSKCLTNHFKAFELVFFYVNYGHV